MKRYFSPFLGTSILVGCALFGNKPNPRFYISRSTARDSVEIQDTRHIHDGNYFIVPLSELKRINATKGLTYLGTENGLHYLRIWTKILASKDEIELFATSIDSCQVENPRELKEEYEIYTSGYRPVDFKPDCQVKEWFSESEREKRKKMNRKHQR